MPVADGIADLDSLTALGNQAGFGVEQTEPSDPTPPPSDGGDEPTVLLSEAQYGLQNESVTLVQQALLAEGFSIPDGATGYFGDETKAAYSQFQQSLGYSGSAADGAPGCTSLTELGSRQGFNVDCTSTGGGTGTSGGRADAPIAAGYSYYISLAFGAPGDYAAGYHTGRDYAADAGTPLVAVLDGTIGTVAWDNDYGNYVVLQAVNGRDYWYCHMNAPCPLSPGTAVNANQVIGHVGQTGNATGPHCHFEDRPRGGAYGQVRDPQW
jgi:murein DD-endopeptidase MepM/ murein hydrolase activator NlpD